MFDNNDDTPLVRPALLTRGSEHSHDLRVLRFLESRNDLELQSGYSSTREKDKQAPVFDALRLLKAPGSSHCEKAQ